MGEAKPMRPIRTYAVSVQGFPPALYSARSPGKALARAYRDYAGMAEDITFGNFMRKTRVRREADPPGVGERIMVAGRPATRVIGQGQYVAFMRDDSDTVLCSHPLDVSPMPAEVAQLPRAAAGQS